MKRLLTMVSWTMCLVLNCNIINAKKKNKMRTKSIYLILTILSVFISCTEEEWMRTDKSRHIIVTAHMPESGNNTRASLSQKEGSLDFLTQWNEGDAVHLHIEQDGSFYEVKYTRPDALPGEVSFNSIPVKNISEDRKSCTIEFDLPEGVDADRPYKIYGFTYDRGLVGTDEDDNEVLVYYYSFYRKNSKSIPLYCEVESNALSSGIEFKHFLAYEILHIKNNSKETITFTHKGFGVDKAWYHLDCGLFIWPSHHSIETKYFINPSDSGEKIEINSGETKEILSCYYPTGEKIENARLKATINGNEVLSSDTKSSDLDIEPAKAYHMYATWDGEKLSFSPVSTPGPGKTPAGLEAIDLGLPSGMLWANMNVGAEKPEDYGLYFAWGETTGYTSDTSDGHSFDWASYKWCNGSSNTMTKYCTISKYGTVDNKKVLELEDDAARVNWGDDWRMPTTMEIQELLDNTTHDWIMVHGINGHRFTSKTNGNSIFIPAAGYREKSQLYTAGEWSHFWSSSLNEGWPDCARMIGFVSDSGWFKNETIRYDGLPVRPVRQN